MSIKIIPPLVTVIGLTIIAVIIALAVFIYKRGNCQKTSEGLEGDTNTGEPPDDANGQPPTPTSPQSPSTPPVPQLQVHNSQEPVVDTQPMVTSEFTSGRTSRHVHKPSTLRHSNGISFNTSDSEEQISVNATTWTFVLSQNNSFGESERYNMLPLI